MPEAFAESAYPRGKLFLQDGDPSQNSAIARDALFEIGAQKFTIPARSPDLNPIENIFNIVKQKIRQDAIKKNIVFESWDSFCERVKLTIETTPNAVIDKTIESMKKRIDLIIKRKGERTKY